VGEAGTKNTQGGNKIRKLSLVEERPITKVLTGGGGGGRRKPGKTKRVLGTRLTLGYLRRKGGDVLDLPWVGAGGGIAPGLELWGNKGRGYFRHPP